ncbi:hypothetical protein Pcinc_004866 [Petrolisthes cinctipes]|uniref:Uncharacterized protein n=1 Tax=Petrolisthes cinctipes TaxID=88211 RepID=A0AAE1GDX0_PETCI|nr:hypothetical protein Pcinc_004866 [Petrolisthes cinctipes]
MDLAVLTTHTTNTLQGIQKELEALKEVVTACSHKYWFSDILASSFPEAPTTDAAMEEEEVLVSVSPAKAYNTSHTFKNCLPTRWKRKSSAELSGLTLHSLTHLLKDLETIVQDASRELVTLLQERQGLQEEVDIRSITIEQLLKFAEKKQLQMGEPFAIQMSVVHSHCGHGQQTESSLG